MKSLAFGGQAILPADLLSAGPAAERWLAVTIGCPSPLCRTPGFSPLSLVLVGQAFSPATLTPRPVPIPCWEGLYHRESGVDRSGSSPSRRLLQTCDLVSQFHGAALTGSIGIFPHPDSWPIMMACFRPGANWCATAAGAARSEWRVIHPEPWPGGCICRHCRVS